MPENKNYTTTCFPSHKQCKLNEQDTQGFAGEVRKNIKVMFTYGRSITTSLYQLCTDTGYRLEDQPGGMNERDGW